MPDEPTSTVQVDPALAQRLVQLLGQDAAVVRALVTAIDAQAQQVLQAIFANYATATAQQKLTAYNRAKGLVELADALAPRGTGSPSPGTVRVLALGGLLEAARLLAGA